MLKTLGRTLAIFGLAGLALTSCNTTEDVRREPPTPRVTTVAFRAFHMDAMKAFYSEALGAKFRLVDTAGLASQFGRVGDLEIKLVPLRQSDDFEGFPTVQIGLKVDDLAEVIALAEKHGGRSEGEIRILGDQLHAAVRDPDGNTIELYQNRKGRD